MAGPRPVVDHFLWMRKDFRDDQEYALVAWDRPGEPASRSVYNLRGLLHAFNGVMRTLSGLPARTMTFTWNDSAQDATAVFVEADAALLVFVFRGCAASAEFIRVVDASLDALAVLAGPAALHREGASSWDAPLVARARTQLLARLFRATAAAAGGALPARLPLVADALGVSGRGGGGGGGAAPHSAAAASPGRASTPGSVSGGGFSPHAPAAPPLPSLPLPAATLAADTELTVLESDVNDALQGPPLPLPPLHQQLLPVGPPRSPYSTASGGDARAGGPVGSPALLRSRPPPTAPPAAAAGAGGADPSPPSPPPTIAAASAGGGGSRGSALTGATGASSSTSAGGGGGSRGVAVDWACTGSAVCVVPARGGQQQQQQHSLRGTAAAGPLPLPAALVSHLRPVDEADLATLLATLLLLPTPPPPPAAAPAAAEEAAAPAASGAGGGAVGLLAGLASESEALGRGFGWHWPPAAADLSLTLTRGRSSRALSAAADAGRAGGGSGSATAGATASAAAPPPALLSSSAAARAITRIRLVALPVAAFARLPAAAAGGGGGGASVAVPRTPILRRTHGSSLDVLRRSPGMLAGGDLSGGGARAPASPAPAAGGRREAPGPPVRHSVALWASRVAFWRPADEGVSEWPDVAVPPEGGGSLPSGAGGTSTTPRGGSGGGPGSQLLRPLFAPLPTPASAAAASATSPQSPGAGLKRAASISGGAVGTPSKGAGAPAPSPSIPPPPPPSPAAAAGPSLPPGLGQTTRLLVLACLEPHAGGAAPEGGALVAAAAAAVAADPTLAAHTAAATPPPPSAGPSLLLVLALERRSPLPPRVGGGGPGAQSAGGPFDAVLTAVGPLAAKCLRRVARDLAVANVAEALAGRPLLLQH